MLERMIFAIVLTEGSIKYKISCDHQPGLRCQVERKAEVLVTVKLPALTGVTIAAEAECQNTGLGDERRGLVLSTMPTSPCCCLPWPWCCCCSWEWSAPMLPCHVSRVVTCTHPEPVLTALTFPFYFY